jgi:hypothetical protein
MSIESSTVQRDASFIVRIWWERRRWHPAIWRGQIIHVQTGQSCFFQSEADMTDFVRRWTGATPVSSHQEETP